MPTDKPSCWTRVEDDTGGGHSMTHFERLYFEGSPDEAAAAILGAFGVAADCSTPEYGACLSFKSHPTFASASAVERGCAWRPGEREPREEDGGQSWRPYATAEAWRAQCESDPQAAIAISQDHRRDRNGSMFVAGRAETLAMVLAHGRQPGPDAAREFVALSRSVGQASWPSSTNASTFARALPIALSIRATHARLDALPALGILGGAPPAFETAAPSKPTSESEPRLDAGDANLAWRLAWLCGPSEREAASLAVMEVLRSHSPQGRRELLDGLEDPLVREVVERASRDPRRAELAAQAEASLLERVAEQSPHFAKPARL